MEDDFQKRNTDCVYFLASPLTCKKGIDCEYRHSETARLNPRDCRYWLAGGCLNPMCAFRHPPLDGRPETTSESASSHQQSKTPANKTNVPCYFYFNGFCNKGERCFYLHGPDETMHTWKSSKIASAAVDCSYSEKKTSSCNDLEPPVETQSFETVPKRAAAIKIKAELELCQPPSKNVAEQSASPPFSASPCEEGPAIRSSSPGAEEASDQSRSHESTGQSSDDQHLDSIEQEEWLESSPGFDVLVNDRSEDFVYEDDATYLRHPDVEDQEHYGQLLGYDNKDSIEYDPAYPDLRISFGREVHDGFHCVDDVDIHNSITKFPFCKEDRVLDRTLQQKRTFFQAELGCKGHSGVDLRDYLKKRRVIDDHYPTYSQIRDRPGVVSRRHLHGRLASKIEVCSVGSWIGNKTHLNDIYKPARYKRSRVGRSRNHFKDRRPAKRKNLLPKISGKITSTKQRSSKDSALFTGPKTLAQIKEEKRKSQENGDCSAR